MFQEIEDITETKVTPVNAMKLKLKFKDGSDDVIKVDPQTFSILCCGDIFMMGCPSKGVFCPFRRTTPADLLHTFVLCAFSGFWHYQVHPDGGSSAEKQRKMQGQAAKI